MENIDDIDEKNFFTDFMDENIDENEIHNNGGYDIDLINDDDDDDDNDLFISNDD